MKLAKMSGRRLVKRGEHLQAEPTQRHGESAQAQVRAGKIKVKKVGSI